MLTLSLLLLSLSFFCLFVCLFVCFSFFVGEDIFLSAVVRCFCILVPSNREPLLPLLTKRITACGHENDFFCVSLLMMLLFQFLLFSFTVTSRIRFGVCPPVPERTDCPSLVWDDCTCDTDCPGTKKCCLNGCNYACLERGKYVHFHQSSVNDLFLYYQAYTLLSWSLERD